MVTWRCHRVAWHRMFVRIQMTAYTVCEECDTSYSPDGGGLSICIVTEPLVVLQPYRC